VAHPQIAVFARLANGQAERVRAIEGQKTLLGRTMHGMYYDAIHDEIFVTQQFAQAILVFRGAANGEEPPLRVIHGSRTQLVAPDSLTVDPVHDEIYIPEGAKILVYPRTGNGNIAPSRVITGPNTGIGNVGGVAVDPQRNIILASTTEKWETSGRGDDASKKLEAATTRPRSQLNIFPRTANGDVKPLQVISGMSSGILHPSSGLIFRIQERSSLGVWHIDDVLKGRLPPRFTFGGPGFFGRGMEVALDPKNQEVLVSDKDLNAILTFHVPEVFSSPSSQQVEP
jgi:hypothetical protein